MTLRQTRLFLKKNRVAVLKGGWSRERPISLKTGAAMEKGLKRLGIPFSSIDVGKDLERVLSRKKIKFAFIALHGTFGEDGQVQNLLDGMGISYTGTGAISSSLAMNKASAKVLMKAAGIPTPDFILISKTEFQTDPSQVLKKTNAFLRKGAAFLKPNDQGSAIGASRVNGMSGLKKALKACFKHTETAILERFTPGREFTVGLLGGRTLPVIEIIPRHAFYDFHSKYARGGSRHLLPAPINKSETKKIQKLSLAAARALSCEVYSRVDFIRVGKNKFSALEVNTIPGMTDTSLFPEAAKAVGIGFDELLLRLASLSLKKRGVR